VTTQRLVLADLPEGTTGLHFTDTRVWACAGCGARIRGGNTITHPDDCPETGMAEERERSEAEARFLAASVAVWREIDRLAAEPDGYHPVRMSVELRQAERAAWERYRELLTEEE